jgi:hypothetical protein
MVGHICLIKSVLNFLPLYFMSIFLMPKDVLFAYFHPTQILMVRNSKNEKNLQSSIKCGCSR